MTKACEKSENWAQKNNSATCIWEQIVSLGKLQSFCTLWVLTDTGVSLFHASQFTFTVLSHLSPYNSFLTPIYSVFSSHWPLCYLSLHPGRTLSGCSSLLHASNTCPMCFYMALLEFISNNCFLMLWFISCRTLDPLPEAAGMAWESPVLQCPMQACSLSQQNYISHIWIIKAIQVKCTLTAIK